MIYNDDIEDPNYSIFTAYNFFIGGDYVRVIILLYILFSTLLNLIIIVAVIISKKKLSFVSKITLNIILINYIHTFSYIFEWVIKIPGKTKSIGKSSNSDSVVGLLLAGNPNNMKACKAQAFCLISSSISQDLLINIFFFLINKSKIPNTVYIWSAILIFAFILPFAFTLFLLLNGALGINDRFCYINKYNYNPEKKNKYEIYSGLRFYMILLYGFRTINLLLSLCMLFKVIIYVISSKLKITYIFKMSFILMVQLITISIGIVYHIFSRFSRYFSANFSGPYLILNTIDGVLFPLSFIITNGMHKILYKKLTGKNWGGEEEEVPYPNEDDDDEDDDDDNNGIGEKSIQMTEFPVQDLSIDSYKINRNSDNNFDNTIMSVND